MEYLIINIIFIILTIFAIVFPIWISRKDSNRMDDTHKKILELVAGVREQTKNIDYNIKEIIKEVANTAIGKAKIEPNKREKVNTEIDILAKKGFILLSFLFIFINCLYLYYYY